jgi:hypothetical protein
MAELIYTMQMSLTVKLADHEKKGCTNANENNVLKSIRYHGYDIHFKIMVSKHAKQTNVKQQENTVSPKSNI